MRRAPRNRTRPHARRHRSHLRRFRRRRHYRASSRPNHLGSRQHLVHAADHEHHPLHFDAAYAAADRVQQAARQQLPDALDRDWHERQRREPACHRQSGLEQCRADCTGVRGRHDLRRKRGALQTPLHRAERVRASSPCARAASRPMAPSSWSSSAPCCCRSRPERKERALLRCDRQAQDGTSTVAGPSLGGALACPSTLYKSGHSERACERQRHGQDRCPPSGGEPSKREARRLPN